MSRYGNKTDNDEPDKMWSSRSSSRCCQSVSSTKASEKCGFLGFILILHLLLALLHRLRHFLLLQNLWNLVGKHTVVASSVCLNRHSIVACCKHRLKVCNSLLCPGLVLLGVETNWISKFKPLGNHSITKLNFKVQTNWTSKFKLAKHHLKQVRTSKFKIIEFESSITKPTTKQPFEHSNSINSLL